MFLPRMWESKRYASIDLLKFFSHEIRGHVIVYRFGVVCGERYLQ